MWANRCIPLKDEEFELYFVKGEIVACSGKGILSILNSIKDGIMTQRDLSRELGIPISTVNSQIRALERRGIISETVNKEDKDYRKKYYKLTAVKFMSFAPSDFNRKEEARDMLLAMRGRPDLAITSMLSWILLRGESMGLDFTYMMKLLGQDISNTYHDELVGDTGEQTVSNLSDFLVGNGLLNGLEVKTYFPITFYGWYVPVRKTYPGHITKSMISSLLKNTIGKFYGREMDVLEERYWEDDSGTEHLIVVLK